MDFAEESNPEPETPPVPSPASAAREPVWLLILGILLFALLMYSSWQPREARRQAALYPAAMEARSGTYLVQYFLQQKLRGASFGQLFATSLPQVAGQAADAWQDAGRKSGDAAYRAKTAINAAALYGVAGQLSAAKAAIEDAIAADSAQAAVFREFLPLYQPSPAAVTFSPPARQLLQDISAGALIRARNALLARDTPAAIAALQPGADTGLRILAVNGTIALVVSLIVLTALVLGFVLFRRVTEAFAVVATPEPSPPPWGIGAALVVVSAVYLCTRLMASGVMLVMTLLGISLADMRLGLLISAAATIVSAIVILGLFLMLSGRNPWDWSVFGWRRTRRGTGYGVLSLLMTAPVIWGGAFLSAHLFKDQVETHQLIPLLQSARDPWIILVLVLMAMVMAPLVEETLFRGILFRACHARLPFWGAAVLSGVLFAVGHAQLVAIIPIAILGILFAFLTRRTESLWASAAAHAAFNGFSTLMALLMAWSLRGAAG